MSLNLGLRMSNKNNLKDLFNKNSSLGSKLTTKTFKSSNDFVVNTELENTEFLKEKAKEINNFKFNVDYSNPANFAKFASAYLYYNDSIQYILDTFPYDGSKEKYQKWRNSSTDLDKYLVDNVWPRYAGYLQNPYDNDEIDPADDINNGIRSVQYPEYISFSGYGVNSLYNDSDNKKDSLNLSFSDGFTIEFYFRMPSSKPIGSWPDFSSRQPIFCIKTDSVNTYFNLVLDLSFGIPKFGVNYSLDGFGQQLPEDSDTMCFVETNSQLQYDTWVHASLVFSIDNIKVYLNGNLAGIREFTALTKPSFYYNETASINPLGFIGTYFYSGSFIGKFWGNLDEFRIWKEARTEKQINDNLNTNVRGTASELNKETSLSVYYKFNEPIDAGTTIVDYSGRLVNGTYFSERPDFSMVSVRQEYADDDPNPMTYEAGDIILYRDNGQVNAFVEEYLQVALDYDNQNGKTLFQRLPAWISEEDEYTTQDLKKLTQIIGAYLDNLYLKISYLSKLKQISYDGLGNEEFYKFAIRNLGFPVIEIFDSADTINLFLDKDNNLSFEERLSDIKTTIYQNLYNNIVPILKTKGTVNSIDTLLKSLSIPDNLYNLNFYSNSDIEHKENLKNYYKNVSFLDFNLQSDSSFKNSNLYLSQNLELDTLYDFESNIKIKVPTYDSTDLSTLSSSILSFVDTDLLGVELYSLSYVRKNLNSNEIKLTAQYLTSGSTVYSLETDYFNTKDSYLDIFIGFSRDSGISSGLIVPDKFNIMAIIDRNEIISASTSITSITSSHITNMCSYDYRIFIGKNPVTDLQTNIAASFYSLSRTSNIASFITDDSQQGIKQPWQENYYQEYNNFNQMFIGFDLSNITFEEGDEAAEFLNIYSNIERDYTFDAEDTKDFRLVSTFTLLDTVDEMKEAYYKVDKINLGKKENPGEYNIGNDVQVLTQDDEFFTKSSRPVNIFFNLERSVYGILNDRMMKVFKTFEDFATIYSPQIEFYRVENKNLIKLREELFKTLDSQIDVDRFQEYYKWLDFDLSSALSAIIPASANSDKKAKNIIESHNLERNKLTRYLLAGTTPKKVTNEAIIYGEKKLSVTYKTETYTGNPLYSKNWWKYHAPRDTNYVYQSGINFFSSSVDGINDARERFRQLAVQDRSLSNNFQLKVDLVKPIEIGQNLGFNEGIIKDTEALTGSLDSSFINDQTYDDYKSSLTYKKKVLNGLKATLGNGKTYNYKLFEPYRWSNLIAGTSIDDTYVSRNPIKQIKSIMSPFTDKYNNRKHTQNYLVDDPDNNKIFPRTIYSSLNKINSTITKAKDFVAPDEFERVYSTNLTKLTGSQFGNYSNNRENVQYGNYQDNNPAFKKALDYYRVNSPNFVGPLDSYRRQMLANLTQSVIPLRIFSMIEDPLHAPIISEEGYNLGVAFAENRESRMILSYGTASLENRESSYVQRFSAPGDFWNSRFNKIYMSPYSTVTYRNYKANKALINKYMLPSLFGGIESGSTTTGSIHKTYRNSNSSSMYYEYNRNNSWHTPFNYDLPRAKYDNFFIQHAIPNNIRRYSDLVVYDRSSKVYNVINNKLYQNMIVGNYVASRTARTYGYEGSALSFGSYVGSTTNKMYDTIIRLQPDYDERKIEIDVTSLKEDLLGRFYTTIFESSWKNGYYNSYFLKIGAPNWVGWAQLRSSQNQIFEYMKKNNLVTKNVLTRNWLNNSTIKYSNDNSFISQSFVHFDNHDYEVDVEYTSYNFETGKEEVKTQTVYVQKPYKLLNSNKDLLQKKLPNLSEFDKIKDNKFVKINKIKYISSLYPKNEYVGLNKTRERSTWTQEEQALLRQFNRRTFWRDDKENRKVIDLVTSQGKNLETGSIYSIDGGNLENPVFGVGEIKLSIGDNPDYGFKPYIQYLSPSTFIEFAGQVYNRDVNLILEQTDKRPYFDTYQKYSQDLKKYLNYSIIPEYNVSENTRSIFGNIDQTLLVQNSGTIFEQENFYDYITTNQIIANNAIKAKIKVNAVKKFNPYNGFYPADYTTKLAEAFSSSFCDSFSGTYYEVDPLGPSGCTEIDASPLQTKDIGYVGALKSLFGSGMIFNSLKAGMGYDYWLPSSGNYDSLIGGTIINYDLASEVDQAYGIYNSINKYKRLSFNNLKTDNIFDKNLIYMEGEASAADTTIEGIKIIKYSFENEPKNKIFNKKINNFLSETENFFINTKKIESKKQKYFVFNTSSLYCMNVKLRKTDDYYNIHGVSGSGISFYGSIFGAPHVWYEEAYNDVVGPATVTVLISGNNAEVEGACDPSYLPVVPSYYYNDSSVNISFNPSKEKYTLDEIFASCSLTELNDGSQNWFGGLQIHENSSANINKTYLTHMIDFFNKKYEPSKNILNNIINEEENLTDPKWEIKTKFESPLLYFGQSSSRPSGGGMWMDYGQYSDTDGVYLSISDVSGTLSLADAVGFNKKDYRIGEIKQQTEIKECIVMVPVDKKGNRLPCLDKQKVAEMEQVMDEYVFPSNLDWKYNNSVRPFIFHSTEFSDVLSRDDLADIWQGLMPSLSYTAKEDYKEVEISLTDKEKQEYKNGLSYIVFKVKKRAHYDFDKYRNGEKDEQRYSYNWPYDYCSLVEMCKIDVEIEEEV